MAATDKGKVLEDLFANLQLRLINQRLAEIQKQKDEENRSKQLTSYHRGRRWPDDDRRSVISPTSPPVDNMDRRSPDYYRYSRYGRSHRPPVDPVLPHHGSFINPVIYTPPAPAPVVNPPNPKGDMMEMMMLQGAQMHQSVMQQMMMSSLRANQPLQNNTSAPAQPPPPQLLPPPQYPPPPQHAPRPASPTPPVRNAAGEVLVPISIMDILNARKDPATADRRWSRESRPSGSGRKTDRSGTSRQGQGQPQEPLIPLSLARELLERRPPSIHHHHHGRPESALVTARGPTPRQVLSRRAYSEPFIPHTPPRTPIQLPPVQSPTWVHQRPVEIPPLELPQVRSRPPSAMPIAVLPRVITPSPAVEVPPQPQPVVLPPPPPKQVQEQQIQTDPQEEAQPLAPPKPTLPFPGSAPLRRFRHMGYAVLFIQWLKAGPIKRLNEEEFLMVIRLREMGKAARNLYTDPAGSMMQCLTRVTAELSTDLHSVLVSGTAKDQKPVFNRVADLLTDMVDIILEITPTTGVLGVGHKSSIHLLVQEGVVIPAGYLWELEEDLLKLDSQGRTKDMDEQGASVCLLGLLIGRGLIDMVLLNPYTLETTPPVQPNTKQATNLRVVGSLLMVVLLEVYRTLYKVDRKHKLVFPPELAPRLCRVEELDKFLDMKASVVTKLEKRLRQWAASYYKKLSQLNKTKR